MWLVAIAVAVFLGLGFVYRVARIWANKEWGKDQLQCDIDYVVSNAEPGDLIHFQGNLIIRWTSPSSNGPTWVWWLGHLRGT